jgi:hypothetical protein
MIIYTHRGNIHRLLAGKERKLGDKVERSAPAPEQAKGS